MSNMFKLLFLGLATLFCAASPAVPPTNRAPSAYQPDTYGGHVYKPYVDCTPYTKKFDGTCTTRCSSDMDCSIGSVCVTRKYSINGSCVE